MKLARVKANSGSVLALKVGENLVDLAAFLRARRQKDARAVAALEILDAGSRAGEPALAVAQRCDAFAPHVGELEVLAPSAIEPYALKDVDVFLPPVARPEKIVAIGRNYLAHALEGSGRVPKEVLFFSKSPSCLIGSGEDIRAPAWAGHIDPEGELAVIVGKNGRYVEKDRAMEHVLGYSIMNDVTARQMQRDDIKAGEPWFRSKSFDTFGPLGPYLVTADEVTDPHALDIKTVVNGEARQQDNTSSLMFRIPDIIAHVSRFVTLKTGDIIATGTPEGMRPVFPGDVVEITVSGLGTLRNRLVAE
jgi:2-keto-4-pentenoate hydratase/2-oxohepta-3-ene-1,7-dioic acid hydratase in catechol pathway